ncbi:hypothetical protein BDV93DRAFT_79767 [Ceratobasidium sp. AG-I]|nr:hypothetical protein BDV93DRAFT_79767 [Ceratobasidium sp. AG-I]
MVSAIVSSLRGAFGRKTAQELTQAEIASILQQTIGQLDKVWVEIQVLVDDETKTEDMAKDVEGLRSQYRNLAYYCAEMSLRNDVVSVKSDLSVFKANQEVAEQLRGDTITLRRDTLNTSKKVLGISSRLEVNMINRRSTTSEGTSYGSDDSLPLAGLPNLIRFGQHIYARLRKHEQKRTIVILVYCLHLT